VLKIQGPARVTGLTEKLLDGSSLYIVHVCLCIYCIILLYIIYVYVTLVAQFNNPTVHSTRKQDVMGLNGTDPFACGSWDRTGAAWVLCSTRARCAVFWCPDDGPVKTSPQLGLIGFTWVYMGLPWFTMVYHGLAIRIAIWLDLLLGLPYYSIWFRRFWGASGQESKLMSLGSKSLTSHGSPDISWLRLLESFKMMDYSVLVGTLSDWGTGEWIRQRSILSGIGYCWRCLDTPYGPVHISWHHLLIFLLFSDLTK